MTEEQIIQTFIEDFKINLEEFAKMEDPGYWDYLLWLLAVGYYFEIFEYDYVQNVILNFGDLDRDGKNRQINMIENYLQVQLKELDLFYKVYGDKLDMFRIESIVQSLPDAKSKLEFLFTVTTGLYPEEDPVGFDNFVMEIMREFDPDAHIQARLQQALSDRNRLNLGSLEERQSRVISAQDLEAYLNRLQRRSVSDLQIAAAKQNYQQSQPENLKSSNYPLQDSSNFR